MLSNVLPLMPFALRVFAGSGIVVPDVPGAVLLGIFDLVAAGGGCLALGQIRRGGERGRGLARAAVVSGVLGLAWITAFLVWVNAGLGPDPFGG